MPLDRPIGILQGRSKQGLPANYFSPTPKETLEYEEGEDDDDGFSQDEEVCLILDNSRSAPTVTSNPPTRRLLQTTLNTVITRGNVTDSVTSEGEPSANSVSARAKLRGQIAGFASQGAVIELDELNSESESDRVNESDIRPVTRAPAYASDSVSQGDADDSPVADEAPPTTLPLNQPRLTSPPLKNPPMQDDIVMGTQESIPTDDTAPHIINNNQYILHEQDEDISYLADTAPANEDSSGTGYFRNEILQASLQGEVRIRCDINRIRARARKRRTLEAAEAAKKKRKLDENDMLPDAGIANIDTAQVDRVLSRVIGKEDFNKMDILGQFNMAFIIARRSKPVTEGRGIDDIFIIGKGYCFG